MSDEIKKFRLVGIVTCPEFQKCRCFLEGLHKSFPKTYQKPDIRPMLNLQWNEYLTKMRRKIGGKMWYLSSDLVVFLDGEILGGDVELLTYLSTKFRLSIKRDFHKLGVIHLREILQRTIDLGRRFIYMTIAVDFRVIGTVLILLYADLVPKTVGYFLKCCKSWPPTNINRIVKGCWIQGAMSKELHRMPCENYVVPHDRRGVLSTCNSAKHTDNSCHFNITLNPAPWMDYKYVAFGQIIHGDEVLAFVENLPTCYEKPLKDIEVTACAEFLLDEDVDAKTIKELETFLLITDQIGKMVNVEDSRDVPSKLSISKYMQGLYAFPTDTILISRYLKTIYEEYGKYSEDEGQDEEEAKENQVPALVAEGKEYVARGGVFLSRKDLRFKSDIYSKSHVPKFRIEDISPTKRHSDAQESISNTVMGVSSFKIPQKYPNTFSPVALHADLEHTKSIDKQNNPLYLE